MVSNKSRCRENKKQSADFSSDWQLFKSSLSKDKNKIVVLEDISIKCDVDSFFNKFWSTKATLPVSEYQIKNIGDTEVRTSEWEQSGSDSLLTLERKIDYLHPNHSPMGPRMARTTKKQKLQKYSNCGIAMNTKTNVKDIPFADCFYLEDQIIVESDSNGGVLLSAFIEIHFVQSTWWKKIIKSNATSGIKAWLTGYSDFLLNGCSED